MYSKFEQLLSERNISTFKVSKDTNIAASTFSDWKHGKSKPKIDKLMILSKYFKVPITYFISNTK